MRNIRNVIFDLGGIFIQLDFSKTDQAFKDLGLANFQDFFSQHYSSPLFVHLEIGKINKKEFYNAFRQITGINASNAEIENAWNAMLLNFPAKRLIWLKEISQRYNVYLFSNTNIIHYHAFQNIFRQNTGKQNFDEYFIKTYYSHDLGMRKPDPAAFKQILINEKLDPGETLFIDDTPKNIEGAKQAGLHTILLLPPKTVCDLNSDHFISSKSM